MKISLHWLWYDFWIGVFYDQKKRIIYIGLLPTIILKVELNNDGT